MFKRLLLSVIAACASLSICSAQMVPPQLPPPPPPLTAEQIQSAWEAAKAEIKQDRFTLPDGSTDPKWDLAEPLLKLPKEEKMGSQLGDTKVEREDTDGDGEDDVVTVYWIKIFLAYLLERYPEASRSEEALKQLFILILDHELDHFPPSHGGKDLTGSLSRTTESCAHIESYAQKARDACTKAGASPPPAPLVKATLCRYFKTQKKVLQGLVAQVGICVMQHGSSYPDLPPVDMSGGTATKYWKIDMGCEACNVPAVE